MATEFTCELCGGTFQTETTEEERMAEAVANGFGPYLADPDQQSQVCDPCYKEVMAAYGPIA